MILFLLKNPSKDHFVPALMKTRPWIKHPDLKGLPRICLATESAHGLYKQFGYIPTKNPEHWMENKCDETYLNKVGPNLSLT